jgi:two-component system sensor histidine kinase YesM
MKFRTSLILSFSTIAVFLSLILGIINYQTSMRYELNAQKSSLASSAQSISQQMDDRLGRMNAIMDYLLSDPEFVDSVLLLGLGDEQELSAEDHLTAMRTLETALTTNYILDNSYRTIFYNKSGDVASSYVNFFWGRLREFDSDSMDYINQVDSSNGTPVLVGEHVDCWNSDQEGEKVFSLVRSIHGHNAGYLEVENTVDSLENLRLSDEDTEFQVVAADNQVLYSTDKVKNDKELTSWLHGGSLQDGEVVEKGGWLVSSVSSDKWGYRIIALRSTEEFAQMSQSMLASTLLICAAIFGACLVVIAMWSYLLTKPLNQLQKIISETNVDNLPERDSMPTMNKAPIEFQMLVKAWQDMKVRLNNALINERRASILQLQAQFDTLQAQVNPHFIYNVLNIISSRGVMDDDESISEMCGALAYMLRYTTGNKDRYSKISDDLKYCDYYFYLLKARYEDRIAFSVNVDDKLKNKIIPKGTLQQIIENSIAHGFVNRTDCMKVTITGTMEKDRWYLQIRDNGNGFSEAALCELYEKFRIIREKFSNKGNTIEMEIGGMGLQNVYARCYILYSTNLIFEVQNDNGAVVTVGAITTDSKGSGQKP